MIFLEIVIGYWGIGDLCGGGKWFGIMCVENLVEIFRIWYIIDGLYLCLILIFK